MCALFSLKGFQLVWLKSSYKQISKLPKNDQQRIIQKLECLFIDPDQIDIKKIKGHNNLYRIRSGNYRVVIKQEKNKKLLIVTVIGHRKNIYIFLKSLSGIMPPNIH